MEYKMHDENEETVLEFAKEEKDLGWEYGPMEIDHSSLTST